MNTIQLDIKCRVDLFSSDIFSFVFYTYAFICLFKLRCTPHNQLFGQNIATCFQTEVQTIYVDTGSRMKSPYNPILNSSPCLKFEN